MFTTIEREVLKPGDFLFPRNLERIRPTNRASRFVCVAYSKNWRRFDRLTCDGAIDGLEDLLLAGAHPDGDVAVGLSHLAGAQLVLHLDPLEHIPQRLHYASNPRLRVGVGIEIGFGSWNWLARDEAGSLQQYVEDEHVAPHLRPQSSPPPFFPRREHLHVEPPPRYTFVIADFRASRIIGRIGILSGRHLLSKMETELQVALRIA